MFVVEHGDDAVEQLPPAQPALLILDLDLLRRPGMLTRKPVAQAELVSAVTRLLAPADDAAWPDPKE